MEHYRQVLKRVGLVLLVVGIIDIAYMIYCITQGQSYSSSLNIFAVAAGIFLIRGSGRAARIVTWFSAFLLAGLVSGALMFPFLMPIQLWLLNFKLYPTSTFLLLLLSIALLGIVAWVYRQLRADPVLRELSRTGHSISPPRLSFALGVFMVAGLAAVLLFVTSGDTARNAILLAKGRYGEEYRYFVNSIHWSGNRVQATLTAYSAHEIRPVQVEWQQE